MANSGLLARCLSGEVTASELEALIRREDPRLHAWVETRLETETHDGPLRGVPYGAKDIIETKGYRTSYGSPLYAGRMGESDAAIIRLLRSRGAVLMGKTQTTAFAFFDPAPTRNPRRPDHTPGGSSSGSAAAVAAGMVPFAIGSQTQGSIIRPASFCGVVGIKPTYGLLPVEGMLPFAPTLDTVGFFTQTALDLRLLWQALGYAVDGELPPVYGVIELPVGARMRETFRRSLDILAAYGCRIERVSPQPGFERLWQAVQCVNRYEGARTHEQRYREYGTAIGLKLAQLVRDGLETSEASYREALATIDEMKLQLARVFTKYPILLSPAAPGPAPRGLGSTGDPRCNGPWTGLGVPVVCIPMPVGDALPLGLQMAAAWHHEASLIAAACHLQALLKIEDSPQTSPRRPEYPENR